jgi:hypothetical protein
MNELIDEFIQKIVKELDYKKIKKAYNKIAILTNGKWMEINFISEDSDFLEMILDRWRTENKNMPLSISKLQEIRKEVHSYYKELIYNKMNDEIQNKIRVDYLGKGKFFIKWAGYSHLFDCVISEFDNEYYPEDETEYELIVNNIDDILIKTGLGFDVYTDSTGKIRRTIEEKMVTEYKKSKEYKLTNMYN